MKKVSNEILFEKINSLHMLAEIKFKGIHERLDALNSQTYKNTAFRHKQVVVNGILAVLGTALLGLIVQIIV